jgi:predicted Zn-dependent protease with MMP-like domain
MRSDLRRLFDELLDQILADLPEHIHRLLEEVPLVVEDEPSLRLLEDMDIDERDTDLCGLHWGIPLTQKSVEHSGVMPDRMMLFREPIFRVAGYRTGRDRDSLERQIRITLLHEIGHHFGLDEDDLARLGYG